jgi:hypothetical protein
LKQYAEWFRYSYPTQATEEDQADKAAEHEAGDGSKPRNGIKSKWEKYKKEFAATQVSTPLFIYPIPPCCVVRILCCFYRPVFCSSNVSKATAKFCRRIVASNDV